MLKNLLINTILRKNNLRKLILINIDIFCVVFSIFLAFFLNQQIINFNSFTIYSLILVLISLPTYYYSGQYKGLSGYLGSSEIYKIILMISINIFLFFSIINLTILKNQEIDFYIILWFL